MSRRIALYVSVPAAALAALLWSSCGGADLDESFTVRPSGELSVDIVLGSGVSFDRGSLEITSHPANAVRVVADVSGWGEYAVDLDVSQRENDVSVVGRVEGFLHWAFGGPTVDVRVFVPQDYTVNARIDGGPLLLEDLVGPVEARVESSEITLRRSEGDVKLRAGRGDVTVEDVEGALSIESGDGGIEVSEVRGAVVVRTGDGSIEIASAKGRVDAATKRGAIEIQRVRGDVRAHTGRGRIELEDIEGDVDVATERGRIDVDDLAGRIEARSGRGSIEVEFEGDPSGAIGTARGEIRVEIATDARFQLDAHTARGEIELDEDLEIARTENPDVAAPPPFPDMRDLREEVREQVARVRENVDRGLRNGNWEELDWSFDWRWEDWHERARRGGDRWRNRDWGWGNRFGRRGERVAGAVNGGGDTLVLRSARGTIQIEER